MTINIPATGSTSFKDPVTSSTELPTADNRVGDTSLAVDTNTLYVWSGTSWLPVGGSSSTNQIVESLIITTEDMTNKYVTLMHTPLVPANVELTVIGGVDQDYDIDYIVVSNRLEWSGYTLDGLLAAGDVLKINYFY